MCPTATKPDITLQVSDDRLKCWLVFRNPSNLKNLTEIDIYELLKSRKINITEKVREKVRELLDNITVGEVPKEPVLIAEGLAPVKPVDERFEWSEELTRKEQVAENESVNFYQQTRLTLVESGAILGRILPGKEGKNGIDVYGEAIKINTKYTPIKLGENVELLEKDGQRYVVATTAGQAFCEYGKIYVRDVLEIKGNVDFETGNIDTGSDVLIRGIVKDLFIVRSKKNISVAKLVESAYLFADGNITIAGGVKGRGKARLEAKGDIAAKFIEYTYVEAGGNVLVGNEVIDSVIYCQGRLIAKNGALIGGQYYATQGIITKTVGSATGVKTIIAAGSDPFLISEIFALEQRIEELKNKVAKIRSTVTPLLQQIKRLTPEQRERATELMFTADNMEMEIEDCKKRLEELRGKIPETGSVSIVISSIVYPNTEIRINNRTTFLRQELKGPVKITLRKVDNITEMVHINQLSGSMYTLKSHRLNPQDIIPPQKPPLAQPGAEENPPS